jgi:sugar phosphate isomerase/epimerase
LNAANTLARPLAVAHLTALDVEPVRWVRVAAATGFDAVGLRLHPATEGGIAYPCDVASDAHRELRHTLAGEGIGVHDVEFIPVVPGLDVASFEALFDAAASLGARCVNVSGDDPDTTRLADTLAALATLAEPFGLRIDLEFMRWRHVASIEHARMVVACAAHRNLAVLVDALHLSRSGGIPDDVAAMPQGLIGSAQLCDASPRHPQSNDEAIHEARENRLAPGEGALPLDALLHALPPQTMLSVEMPMPTLALQARMELAYIATRRVIEVCAMEAQ